MSWLPADGVEHDPPPGEGWGRQGYRAMVIEGARIFSIDPCRANTSPPRMSTSRSPPPDGYAPGFVEGPRADRHVAHPAGHADRTLVGRHDGAAVRQRRPAGDA